MEYGSHFVKPFEVASEEIDLESKIGGVDSNFSKHFGLKKVGVHFFILQPGLRSSRPHAESIEDEFVFVVKGEVDLWLNGKIKRMQAGDSIGFPPGTGVGHTFINNSDSPVELFIAGDRTKKENRYQYHLAPELKALHSASWWEDMPIQVLGGHDGLPGKFDASLLDSHIEVLKSFENIPKASFSYKGDSETFSEGRCLSRHFGLKSIAVWIEKLPPSKRSSWPHAHSVEEEFVFTLKGQVSVWLDGRVFQVDPMTAIDFRPGSGVAHTLMNETNEDVYYLCVGECSPENDKIYYPLHPARNAEVKTQGFLWEDYSLKKND